MTKKTILHIDSSPQPEALSRQLTQHFVDAFCAAAPKATIIQRDLNANPPPFVDLGWVQNAYAPKEKQDGVSLQISDQLTDEFLAADVVVLGMPMYNWGMPAIVKAWFDQIIRMNKTFAVTGGVLTGLCQPDKKAIAIVTRSDKCLPGEPFAHANFQDGHFKYLMEFMGVKDVRVEALQGSTKDADAKSNLQSMRERLKKSAQEMALR
jgi:FMN-dependent NADH-azoreductase